VAAVAGGKVDAGALNISVWEKLVARRRSIRPWCACSPPPATTTTGGAHRHERRSEEKLTDAFLALDPKKPQDKVIMDLQRASKFIPTKAENYKNIEAAAQNAGLLK
jgi:phosphonate transport system substrate-binding protein